MWISVGGSSRALAQLAQGLLERHRVRARVAVSSLANEQNRHEASQTFVASIRMLRLKYVRSPCRRSRSGFASRPSASKSGA